ncbi:MAG: hypothetical protein HY873_04140, partial [Chloroflexi bacterium]|nr:hypothetical protein [Chloroflexota bacterium]
MNLRNAAFGILAGIAVTFTAWASAPASHADEWTVGQDYVDATLDAGYAPDGTAFSGT